jgi:hypothetical protein
LVCANAVDAIAMKKMVAKRNIGVLPFFALIVVTNNIVRLLHF